MPLLRPDHYVTSVLAIDLATLKSSGITTLLLDVDNTCSPHHSPEVLPEVAEWLAALAGQGFKALFVSNNWHDDITDRCQALGLGVVPQAMKPLPFGFRAAARQLGVAPRECAVVGDQIFTDILGGNLAGMTTVLVTPLTENDMAHTVVLRRIERLIMGRRVPQA